MDKIWSMLIHFGTNMWNEEGNYTGKEDEENTAASSTLRFSQSMFRELVQSAREKGANTIVLDIGEALRYESHPEIAVNGSWPREKLIRELEFLKSLGYDVVPKLNFSACHDLWLGDYSRMVSSPIYYRVCADLIKEVCDIFKPKYFHIGMDEENEELQRDLKYCVIRQHELWWHDLYFFVNCIERENVRAWMWSDYMWSKRDEFVSKCPKIVIQSNWFYGTDFSPSKEDGIYGSNVISSFEYLDKHGFDQVPTGSNYFLSGNMQKLVSFCSNTVSEKKLLGFMHAPWYMTFEHGKNREKLFEAANELGESFKWYNNR